ncbi:MAG: PAS domain S-box protein [Magnetovibrio sp.]|nr:PAS domain S-box protein [Magnetovibrio sp.]
MNIFLTAVAAFVAAATALYLLGRRHEQDLAAERQRREQAEARLRHEQQRFTDFADVSSDWFWEMDADLRFTRFSGHILEALGFDGSAYLGRTRRDIAADNIGNRRWADHLDDLDAHRPFQDFRYGLKLPDGRTLLISVSGQPVFGADGAFMGYRGSGTDLTPQQQIQEALGNSEQRLRAVVENAPWSMFLKDMDGRYLMANRQFLAWHGADEASLIGQTTGDRFDAETAAVVADQDRRALEAGAALEEEIRVRFPDGAVRDVLVIKFPVLDAAGRTTALGGINIDITARRRDEAKFRATQERLDLIAGNLPVALFRRIKAADGTISYPYVSAGVRAFLGFEPDEVKRNPFLFQQGVHPEDQERWNEENHLSEARMRPFDLTFRRVQPTGEVRWVHTIAQPHRGPDGEVIWDGVVLDITDQKRAEAVGEKLQERLYDAVNSLQEGFALYDADDRLIVANREYQRVLPMAAEILARRGTFEESIREVVGIGLLQGLEGREEAFIERRLAQHRAPGDDVVVNFANGNWYLLKELRTPEGGTVVTFSDITALKQAEEAARTAKERAELASRTKTEFLANMSHELRTPLNSIIGMSSVITSQAFGKVGNKTYREYAGDINASGQHLLAVIGDILDIAKIEAGEIGIIEDNVDLAALIGDCERMVGERAFNAGVRLAIEISPAAAYLWADGRRLRQIVINLLSNAIKFTPEKGTVTVTSSRDAAGGLAVAVRDTGIGIAPEDIPRVLEPFGQVESIMTRTHEGSGLGLTLVKSLTEAHGGRLELDSAVGEGTTVTLRFPAARALGSPSETPPSSREPADARAAGSKS